MYFIGMLALLGFAQAETPTKSKSKTTDTQKEEKEKKEQAADSKKSNSKRAPVPAKASAAKSTSSQSTPQPSATVPVSSNPAQQTVGSEQSTQPSAHSPIGNSASGQPTTPVGSNPSYERAPSTVERPQVGKESDQPTAHTPIGAPSTPSNRPERTKPTREPEGRIDRTPPTKQESTRPERTKPTREPEGRIDRTPPQKSESTRPNKEPQVSDTPQQDTEFQRDIPNGSSESVPSRSNPTRTRPSRNTPTQTKPDSTSGTRTPERRTPETTPSQKIERKKPNGSGNSTSTQVETAHPPKEKPQKGRSFTPTAGYGTSTRKQETTSEATIDRGGQALLGLGTLSYASDYVDGGAYQDGGMGISLGVRFIPQIEIEAAYGRYTDSLLASSRERLNRPFQLTGQYHAFPNHLVSPFVVGGYVWNQIELDDHYMVLGEQRAAEQEGTLTGLVLGGGLTVNVHQHVALELDARIFQYNNIEFWQPAGDTATLVSMGVVLGF